MRIITLVFLLLVLFSLTETSYAGNTPSRLDPSKDHKSVSISNDLPDHLQLSINPVPDTSTITSPRGSYTICLPYTTENLSITMQITPVDLPGVHLYETVSVKPGRRYTATELLNPLFREFHGYIYLLYRKLPHIPDIEEELLQEAAMNVMNDFLVDSFQHLILSTKNKTTRLAMGTSIAIEQDTESSTVALELKLGQHTIKTTVPNKAGIYGSKELLNKPLHDLCTFLPNTDNTSR